MLRPRTRTTARINLFCLALVFCFGCYLFTFPLRYRGDLLACAQDDFYYYLVIARNLAAGLGSTFDGSTPTNGYHPLYELLLWGFAKVAHTLPGIYRLLAGLDVLSAVAIFAFCRGIYQKHLGNPLLANGAALLALYVSLFKIYHQMEVTLTLPLCFLLLLLVDRLPERLSARWGFGLGIASAALILSRLDSGILVGLCGLGVLLTPDLRRRLARASVLSFAAGVVPPMAFYFAINEHFFHTLLPISGAAKQAREGVGFYWPAMVGSTSPESAIMFLGAIVGLVLLALLWKRVSPHFRVVCLAGLLFPFVHWLTLFWISDWKLWGWYGYSLRPAAAITVLLALIAFEQRVSERFLRAAGGVIFACGLAVFLSAHYRVDYVMVDIADAAESLKQFAAQHPGRYAMGDRAGMVGYSIGQPLLQTEGLVMDRAYLAHIVRRDPLIATLKSYNVRYYVGFMERKTAAPVKPLSGCFDAREPAQGGPRSPTMRSEICVPPIWHFDSPSGNTVLFDLDQIRSDSAPAKRNSPAFTTSQAPRLTQP